MKYNPQIHHRRSIRLKGYDYSWAGAYFITICTKDRKCLFGEITNGEMTLNEMGQIAYNEWLRTPELCPNVSLDVFAIMPNHMHGIIVIIEDENEKRGGDLHSPDCEIINFTNESSSHGENIDDRHEYEGECKGECYSPRQFRSPSNNIGAMVRGYKSSVAKQINLINYSGSIWQRNYHEHIIRTEMSNKRICDYIINNPKRWIDDRFHS